jgi:DNA-binding transcriptional ArsR family regulator
MGKADSVEGGDGRLSPQLATMLEPNLRDALDHPLRRGVLRRLNRSERSQSVAEIRTELPSLGQAQLSYHLRVLLRSGAVASEGGGGSKRARYVSEVLEDDEVRAALRATEQWDRERQEAMAAANASPLLTMFRVPRPVRTIRLRNRGRIDVERDC